MFAHRPFVTVQEFTHNNSSKMFTGNRSKVLFQQLVRDNAKAYMRIVAEEVADTARKWLAYETGNLVCPPCDTDVLDEDKPWDDDTEVPCGCILGVAPDGSTSARRYSFNARALLGDVDLDEIKLWDESFEFAPEADAWCTEHSVRDAQGNLVPSDDTPRSNMLYLGEPSVEEYDIVNVVIPYKQMCLPVIHMTTEVVVDKYPAAPKLQYTVSTVENAMDTCTHKVHVFIPERDYRTKVCVDLVRSTHTEVSRPDVMRYRSTS